MSINIACGKEAIMYMFLVFFLAFRFQLEGGGEVKKGSPKTKWHKFFLRASNLLQHS